MRRNVGSLLCSSVTLVLFSTAAFGQIAHIGNLAQETDDITRLLQNASAQVQAQVSQIPLVADADVQHVPISPTAPATVGIVDASVKARLVAAVDTYATEKTNEQNRFSLLATVFLIAGAVLAVAGSVCSFLEKWNTTAGIIGLVVVAVVSAPTLYPMNALADFYRSLATQARVLQADCELKSPFTLADYDSTVDQYTLLLIYEERDRPRLASSTASTEDLATRLQSFRSSTPTSAVTHP